MCLACRGKMETSFLDLNVLRRPVPLVCCNTLVYQPRLSNTLRGVCCAVLRFLAFATRLDLA